MGNYKKNSDEFKVLGWWQQASVVSASATCGETANVEKTRSKATAIKPYRRFTKEPFSEMPK